MYLCQDELLAESVCKAHWNDANQYITETECTGALTCCGTCDNRYCCGNSQLNQDFCSTFEA